MLKKGHEEKSILKKEHDKKKGRKEIISMPKGIKKRESKRRKDSPCFLKIKKQRGSES